VIRLHGLILLDLQPFVCLVLPHWNPSYGVDPVRKCPYCGQYQDLIVVDDPRIRFPQYGDLVPSPALVCPKCGVILRKSGESVYPQGLSPPGHP